MGLMDKFLGYMKLGDDEDDGYYDDEYDDYDEAPVEKKPKIKRIQKAGCYEEEERPVRKKTRQEADLTAAEEKQPVKKTSRKAQNFLVDDDEFEFEFLNMDDKDL